MAGRKKRLVQVRDLLLPHDWWRNPYAWDLTIDPNGPFYQYENPDVQRARVAKWRKTRNAMKAARKGVAQSDLRARGELQRTVRNGGWRLDYAIAAALRPGHWYFRWYLTPATEMDQDSLRGQIRRMVRRGLLETRTVMRSSIWNRDKRPVPAVMYCLTPAGEAMRRAALFLVGPNATEDAPLGDWK